MSGPFEGETGAPQGGLSQEDKTWGLVAHLASLSGYVGVPLGWILGPLVVYLVKKESSAFATEHAREALNMGISVTIYLAVCIPLVFVVGLGVLLGLVIAIGAVVLSIVAAIKANEGRTYRYPLIFRFVS